MSSLRVEWDSDKERRNRLKHGIGFDEVRSLFDGTAPCLVLHDEFYSDEEDRFLAVGLVQRGVVVVSHTEPADDVVRIISARVATASEKRLFREHLRGRR